MSGTKVLLFLHSLAAMVLFVVALPATRETANALNCTPGIPMCGYHCIAAHKALPDDPPNSEDNCFCRDTWWICGQWPGDYCSGEGWEQVFAGVCEHTTGKCREGTSVSTYTPRNGEFSCNIGDDCKDPSNPPMYRDDSACHCDWDEISPPEEADPVSVCNCGTHSYSCTPP